jgi:hypothetical protein
MNKILWKLLFYYVVLPIEGVCSLVNRPMPEWFVRFGLMVDNNVFGQNPLRETIKNLFVDPNDPVQAPLIASLLSIHSGDSKISYTVELEFASGKVVDYNYNYGDAEPTEQVTEWTDEG